MSQSNMPEVPEQRDATPNCGERRGSGIQLVAIGLLALLLIIVWLEVAGISKQFSRVEEIDQRLQAVSQTVSDQSHLIGRVLGVVIPVKVPDVVEARFAAVEQLILDEARWPKDADEVRKIASDFAGVVGTVPPWVQEELLPRIVPRRWELETLSLLRQEIPVELGARVEMSDAMLTHYTDRPDGVSEKLVGELLARQGGLEKSIDELERHDALKYADAAMSGNGDLNEAIARLAKYDEADSEAGSLRERLSNAAFVRAVDADLATFETELERVEGLKDDSLRDHALMRHQQALLDLKLRLVAWGKDYGLVAPRIAKLEESLATVAKASTSARADFRHEVNKNYQVWALQQIKAVPKFDALENAEVHKISSILDRKNPLSDARKRAESVAQENLARHLIDRMARIDQHLLDEAVAIWFRKVYQDRFDKLGEAWQLRVVESFATARKQPLVTGQ